MSRPHGRTITRLTALIAFLATCTALAVTIRPTDPHQTGRPREHSPRRAGHPS